MQLLRVVVAQVSIFKLDCLEQKGRLCLEVAFLFLVCLITNQNYLD